MHFRGQKGRIHLELSAHKMGEDLWINLQGGDKPHVGAIALADPNGVQVLVRNGHKEGELARDLALLISKSLNCAVSFTCGIHLDAITPGEIQDVVELSRTLVDDFIQSTP